MSLRQRNKLRTRSQILEAAAHLFTAQGVANTTTRDIAERAGISYQTLYNHFSSKSRIVHGLLEEDMAQWSAEVDGFIKRYEGDVLFTLEQIFRHSLQLITQNEDKQQLWRIIAASKFARELNSTTDFASMNAVAHEQFHALLSLAQGMGQIAPTLDMHLMAHTLFSLTDYALTQFYLGDIDAETFLITQREQIALVLTPYLVTSAP